MKRFKKIAIYIITFILISILIFNLASIKTVSNAKAIPIKKIDFTQIKDGKYQGSYKIFPVNVSVKVTIENKQITNIELLEHFNGMGTKAEIIIEHIIKKQTLEVDNITGATVSSIVIKKAIEDSLINN